MKNKEIPGPTIVVDNVYEALANETRGHTDQRFVAIYNENKKISLIQTGK